MSPHVLCIFVEVLKYHWTWNSSHWLCWKCGICDHGCWKGEQGILYSWISKFDILLLLFGRKFYFLLVLEFEKLFPLEKSFIADPLWTY